MSTHITPQFKLYIEQGTDFATTLQWLAGGMFMAPIELVEEGYPTVITVSGHGLNASTPHPVIISGVEGCPDLNNEFGELPYASRIDDNMFSLPRSSVGHQWIPGTGELTYHVPVDLTNYTGVFKIRKNWWSTEVIHEGTTENGGMVLYPDSGSIELLIDKVDTAAFTFKNAVYDVDLTIGDVTTRIFKGPVTLERDI